MLMIVCIIVTIFGYRSMVISFNPSKIVYETRSNLQDSLNLKNEAVIKGQSEDKIVVRVEVDYSSDGKLFINDVSKSTSNNEKLNATTEEINNERKKKNDILKQYHLEINEEAEKEIKVLGYVEKYVSKYSPYIEYTYERSYYIENQKEILKEISSKVKVKKVYILDYDKFECNDQLDFTVRHTGIVDICADRTLTGDGIIVGQLESGYMRRNESILADVDCEIYQEQDFGTSLSTDHATYMVAAMAGKNGIAPDIKLKSAAVIGTITDEIDWLVEKDVNIINMSFTEKDPNGKYDSTSAYIDYISYRYKIIMVAAAGNLGNTTKYIGNPGLGCNVITVGASIASNRAVASFSSSEVSTNEKVLKPTIVTSGTDVLIDELNSGYQYVSGTSISSAITTANIVLALEKYPFLIGSIPEVLSLITANAIPFTVVTYPTNSSYPLNSKAGAGRLYMKNVFNHIYDKIVFKNSKGTAGATVYSHELRVKKGQTIRASLSWMAKSDGTIDGLVMGDYDLYLKKKSGEFIVQSVSSKSIVELLSYTFEEDMVIRLDAVQYAADRVDNVEWMCICYRIFDVDDVPEW